MQQVLWNRAFTFKCRPAKVIHTEGMAPNRDGRNPLKTSNSIWKFFISVKLTVVLLLTIAATSIIGTIIPQNESPTVYARAYGEFLYRFFDVINLFDMYHSGWFRFLVLMLTVNILACSIDRFPTAWKIVSINKPKFNAKKFNGLSQKTEFKDERTPQTLVKIYQPIIASRFGYSQTENADGNTYLFAEKWRWNRLGVYVVHLSILLLLAGAMVGSIFGFEGYVNIAEGESVNKIRLKNSNAFVTLDFEIKCEDFNLSLYANGAPSEYRSSLTIIEQGKPVLQKDIIVNDPLRYRGINLFQASYGQLPPEPKSFPAGKDQVISLNFVSNETGMRYKKETRISEIITLPENRGTFVIEKYTPSTDFMGQNIGEAFRGILTPPNGDPVAVTLPLRFPNFDKMRKGEMIISTLPQANSPQGQMTTPETRYYTGLQVTKDPGVWLVYSGFIVMILGCMVTFFMPHQQVCIGIHLKGKESRITISGTSNKNQVGMQHKVEKIAAELIKA
jgi:cytochrome c biogenesis protein